MITKMLRRGLIIIFLTGFTLLGGQVSPVAAAGLTVGASAALNLNNSAELNIAQNLVNNGTITCNATAVKIYVAGDWTGNSGTFTCGSSTVTFDGAAAQNITTGGSGANNWNALVVTNASAGGVSFLDGFTTATFTDTTHSSTLKFVHNEGALTNKFVITAVAGLTLTGDADEEIVLDRSSGTGSQQWEIYPSGGGWSVSYVNVSNSVNSASTYINPSNSINGGNTTNWFTPTLVDLVEFVAIGHFKKVLVKWKTASEMNNAGFNIYRREKGQADKDYVKINSKIIPGLGNSAVGKEYTFWDDGVIDGVTYFYLLEDVEFSARSTFHGPVEAHPGMDSDRDGMTDDWENYYGLDPHNPLDASLDSDNDGITNLEEFLQGTEPISQGDKEEPPSEKTDEDWDKKILLVADDADEAYEAIFETISDSVMGYIPQGDAFPIYLGSYTNPADCKKDIIDKINEGCLVLNYVGHGNLRLWAHENIFNFNDIPSLTNQNMLPFIVTMTCGSGYFVYPQGFDCLAEGLLLAKDKGAIACFMPTGTSEYSQQKLLDEGLFEALFKGEDSSSLGAATTKAKLSVFENAGDVSKNVIQTYTLFGDPALELKGDKIPPKVEGVFPLDGTKEVEIADNISITFDEPMDKTAVAKAFVISPQVSGSITWQDNTLIFKPGDKLAYSTKYIVTVDTGATDIAGNSLDGNGNGMSEGSPVDNYRWSFTTEDKIPPKVVAVSPLDRSKGVDIFSNITITFDEPMDKTVTPKAFVISPQVSGSITWQDKTLIFKPGDKLAYNTKYSVVIGTGATDIAGNSLDGNGNGISENSPKDDYKWCFATEPPPPVLWVWPLSLHFGRCDEVGQLYIMNKGKGVLEWRITTNCAWIKVKPVKGSSAGGKKDIVKVDLNRNMLKPGVHKGIVSISSNGGSQDVSIEIEVQKNRFPWIFWR